LTPNSEPDLVELGLAAQFALAARAPSTLRAYTADFRVFANWCREHGLDALPALPSTVAAFLAVEAGQNRRSSTISRRVAGIHYCHQRCGHESPTTAEAVRATLHGIRRTLGTACNRREPAVAEKITAMARPQPGLIGMRDRALLLLGFAGALRRTELVALDVDDLEFARQGLRVRIRRSKTDQDAEGTTIAIAKGSNNCPVQAIAIWLESARIETGALFRRVGKDGKVSAARLSDRSVTGIVKQSAKRAGLDPRRFSAHSLRSGFLTSAAGNGASIFKMMDVSRHKSIDALRTYVRDAELFRDHAGSGLL
jgi:site-specific recombinase XerD